MGNKRWVLNLLKMVDAEATRLAMATKQVCSHHCSDGTDVFSSRNDDFYSLFKTFLLADKILSIIRFTPFKIIVVNNAPCFPKRYSPDFFSL